MKNLKRALSLVLSTAMMVGMMVVGTGATFTDVAESDHKEAIEVMSMVGIMEGVSETEFAPEMDVTRDQMAVIMCNLLDLKLNGAHPFTDVADWADDYVGAIYINGYTAGKTATTYGGSDKITTAEAALMIMKTLGYFEYQGEFGDDWLMATVKRATELQLFKDIDAGVKETLNRGEVAQMVLNALDEYVVLMEENGGLTVEGNGISVSSKATYYPNYIECDEATHTSHRYIDLAEKLFGETLNDVRTTDAFGRPATKWTYTGEGKNESVLVADEAAIVFTAKTGMDDVKKALKEYSFDAADAAEVYTNGLTNPGSMTAKEALADQKDAAGNVTVAGLTDNGKRVEIFVNKDLKITDVVVIDEEIGKVTLVTAADEEKETKRNVTVDGKTFETEDFAKKDIVIYTQADNVIKSMALAEMVEGKITAVANDGSYIKVDGVTYKNNYAANITGIALGDTVELYVDSYGYVMKVGDVNKATASVSEYVLVYTGAKDQWGDKTVKVVNPDGTVAVMAWDDTDGQGFVDANGDFVGAIGMYTYEKTDDGYKFTAAKTKLENGKYAGFDAHYDAQDSLVYDKKDGTLSDMAIADDGVFFVQKMKYDETTSSWVVASYTAVSGAELKKADAVTVNSVYGNKATTGFTGIEFGYVTSALEGTSDLLYGYVTAGTEQVKNADKVSVDSVTFWNGTEPVTLLASASTATNLEKGDFFSYKLNEDGEIDVASIVEITNALAVVAYDGETIGVTDAADANDARVARYNITDDTIIIYVDTKNVKGIVADDIETAEETFNNAGDKTGYVANVNLALSQNPDASNGRYDVTVLFVDVNDAIEVPVAPAE